MEAGLTVGMSAWTRGTSAALKLAVGKGVPHQGHRSMQVGSSPRVGPEKEGGKIMPAQLDLVGGSPELPFPKPAAPSWPRQIPI